MVWPMMVVIDTHVFISAAGSRTSDFRGALRIACASQFLRVRGRSADFQSAVSRISNPQTLPLPGACRLEVGDTAD
jgi:hypothetical protein